MTEFLFVIAIVAMVAGGSYNMGIDNTNRHFQQKCVAKYSDMPHNKVQQHCKEILEFKK